MQKYLQTNSLATLLTSIVPQQCLYCDNKCTKKRISGVCNTCLQQLPFYKNYCLQCGQPLAKKHAICGRCLHKAQSFTHCFCPFTYQGNIQESICAMKYQQQWQNARHLARLFYQEAEQVNIAVPDAIFCVPMHKKKLAKRGFNPSVLLGRYIAQYFDVPVYERAFIKTKPTPAQSTLNYKKRQSNVRNSFTLQEKNVFQHIAIIDDVITTGATMQSLSILLKKQGTNYIQAWGIAHSV